MDTNTESNARECPYCKEEIKADAIRCKHCRSTVAPEKPTHSGTCPYCKEAIHPEAIKCKHCGSAVGPQDGCQGCGESQTMRRVPMQYMRVPGRDMRTAGGGEVGDPEPVPVEGGDESEYAVSCGSCVQNSILVWGGVIYSGSRTCTARYRILGTNRWVESRWAEKCGLNRFVVAPM